MSVPSGRPRLPAALVALLVGCAGDRAVPATDDASTASSPPERARCGEHPLRPCPLQDWMEAALSAQLRRGDGPALARSLRALAGFAPPDSPDWSAVALRGAAAAAAGDIGGVRETCRDCHGLYRAGYRRHHRDRPLPSPRGGNE